MTRFVAEVGLALDWESGVGIDGTTEGITRCCRLNLGSSGFPDVRTSKPTLRRLAARRIVHHHPARAHEVACGALDVEVVHDLGPRARRDADDGRGARAGSLPVYQRGYCSRSRESSTNQSGTARDGNGIDFMTPSSMFRVAIASVGAAAY